MEEGMGLSMTNKSYKIMFRRIEVSLSRVGL